MSTVQVFLKFSWRSLLVALGYIAGLMIGGILGAMLSQQLSSQAGRESSLLLLLIASLLLGAFLGPFASRLALSRAQHFVLWSSLILFNLGSVTLEGAYFAPDLVSISVPMLILQQLLATIGAALVITKIFGAHGQAMSWVSSIQIRPWYSWVWRFIVSAMSYLFFYFVFGGLNYQLVTKPYYQTHAGGLTVPALNVVLIVESIRSLIIVFSVFLFLLSIRGTRRQVMLTTGWLLFAIGGIVPLIWQIGSLPLFLLAASAVEIFFQNFLTGVVAVQLLGIEETH
jgi:hypothetical protein